MNKDVADRWVAALRSGNYQQGRGALASRERDTSKGELEFGPDKYCCLGVLCEIALQERVPIETVESSPGNVIGPRSDQWMRSRSYDVATDFLPPSVQSWAGMETNDGTPTNDVGEPSLSDLNDDDHYSFSQIADFIEENWEAL